MTESQDGGRLDNDASARAREEAQRRIEEILGEREAAEKNPKSRRTRAILIAALILLLLLLCGVGAFLYRTLAPSAPVDDADLAGISWIRSIYGYGPAEGEQFINPNDAATDPDGVIWIADPGTAQVAGFRGDGTYVTRIPGNIQTGEPFRLPARIAVDGDGILYVVDRANETLTIMDGTTRLATASIPGLTSVDVNDEMIVAGSQAGFAILDKDGNVQTIVGTKGSGEDQFDSVGGVAIDSAARTIYVVDTFNNRLSAWDYEGKRKWAAVLGNPANNVRLEGGASIATSSTAPAQLQLPTDITVDGNGRPMVLDAFDFTISAFDPADGTFVDKWGTFGDKDGQFMYPTGFSYDSSRDWFVVADTSNKRAQIVRIPGTGATGASGVLSGLSRFLSGPARALWPLLVLIPLTLIGILVARWMKRRNELRLEAESASLDGPSVETVEE